MRRARIRNPVLSEEDKAELSEWYTLLQVPAKESDKFAMEWLKTHNNRFSGFVNNAWLPKSDSDNETRSVTKVSNILSLEHYADVSTASRDTRIQAAENSHQAFESWQTLSGKAISNFLTRIAGNIKKHEKLFSLLECVSSGKTLHRTSTKDVPNLIQSFEYYALLALTLDQYKTSAKPGVACVIAEQYNEPSLSISWRVASLLAAGNVVLLFVDVKSCFSAFLLAELCSLSGLPAGVLNVLPVDQQTFFLFIPKVDKVFFSGYYTRSQLYINMSSLHGIPCEVLISRRPVAIVYDNSDLSSAAHGVIEMLCFSDTRSARSGCKVFVQSSVEKKFVKVLKEQLSRLCISENFSKSDMCCIVTGDQKLELSQLYDKAVGKNFKIFQTSDHCDENIQFRPTLICNVPTTSNLNFESIGGPLILTESFRTVTESIELFNCNQLGSDVSIWTNIIPQALEVAGQLKAGTIWLNSQNVFDPSLTYGRSALYATSAEGGQEAFFRHLNIKGTTNEQYTEDGIGGGKEIESYGLEALPGVVIKSDTTIKKSYGLHIGGMYKEPSGSTYITIYDSQSLPVAYVANGSSSDLQKAVSSAVASQQKWGCQSGYKRSQLLLKTAEALEGKKEEFAKLLSNFTGFDLETSMEEVEESLSILFSWLGRTLPTCGSSLDASLHHIYQFLKPVGVIGIQCPDDKPLLSFLSMVAPSIVLGNAVVVIPNEKNPLPAFKMCEIFHSSGCPSGILNVISGSRANLTRHLCLNQPEISAVWFSADGAAFIYNSCITHPKRVFDCRNRWELDETTLKILVSESTQLQTIYSPRPTMFPN